MIGGHLFSCLLMLLFWIIGILSLKFSHPNYYILMSASRSKQAIIFSYISTYETCQLKPELTGINMIAVVSIMIFYQEGISLDFLNRQNLVTLFMILLFMDKYNSIFYLLVILMVFTCVMLIISGKFLSHSIDNYII